MTVQFRDPKLETSGKIIGFYPREFYVFDNFSSFAVDFRGEHYATAEHAYQASKFFKTAPEIAKEIRRCYSADEARRIAFRHTDKFPNDWRNARLKIMEEILRAKLAQNPYVAKKLRDAKILNLKIVEDSPKDDFWGWGKNRDGQNNLGKLWMRLRDELDETEEK